jgi:hypothetical protein
MELCGTQESGDVHADSHEFKITNTYKPTGTVDTGDSSHLLMNIEAMLASMLASMLGLLIMIIRRRRREG